MTPLKQFLPFILISLLVGCAQPDNNYYTNHENDSKNRYDTMQIKLNEFVKKEDTAGLRLLSAQLDIQLKLEDFLIKFREADQIKRTLFLNTGVLTAIVSIITTLITLFIARYSRR